MGRTPRPVTMLVHPDLIVRPEFVALKGQGHWVEPWPDLLQDVEVILGPSAWRFTQDMTAYLPMVLKTVRAWKEPK